MISDSEGEDFAAQLAEIGEQDDESGEESEDKIAAGNMHSGYRGIGSEDSDDGDESDWEKDMHRAMAMSKKSHRHYSQAEFKPGESSKPSGTSAPFTRLQKRLASTLSDTEEPVAKRHAPEKSLARVSKSTQCSRGNDVHPDGRPCLEIGESPEAPSKKGKEVVRPNLAREVRRPFPPTPPQQPVKPAVIQFPTGSDSQ